MTSHESAELVLELWIRILRCGVAVESGDSVGLWNKDTYVNV